jgi:hypothetical protein
VSGPWAWAPASSRARSNERHAGRLTAMLTDKWAHLYRETHAPRGRNPNMLGSRFQHQYHILWLTPLAIGYEFHLYYDI